MPRPFPFRRPPAARGLPGFSLLEVLGALGVSSLIFAGLAGLWQSGGERLAETAAARHLEAVARGARDYAGRHWRRLSELSSPTSGPRVGVAELVAEGSLPPGFAEESVWGQSVAVHFRKQVREPAEAPGSERLFWIVLTSGGRGSDPEQEPARFFSVSVPAAARQAGPGAGFLPLEEEGTLVSAFGGYALPLADYGLTSPGPGHLGVYGTLDPAQRTSDFLFRVPVAGHPEHNRLETDLDMAGRRLRDLGSLQLRPPAGKKDAREADRTDCREDELGRLFLEEDGIRLCRRLPGGKPALTLLSDTGNAAPIRAAGLYTDGESVPVPDCPPGTRPQVFAVPAAASSGPVSPAMAGWRAWVSEEEGGRWRAHLRVKNTDQGEDDWYSAAREGALAPWYGSVFVMSLCARGED